MAKSIAVTQHQEELIQGLIQNWLNDAIGRQYSVTYIANLKDVLTILRETPGDYSANTGNIATDTATKSISLTQEQDELLQNLLVQDLNDAASHINPGTMVADLQGILTLLREAPGDYVS